MSFTMASRVLLARCIFPADNGSEYHSSHINLTAGISGITLCVGTSKQEYQLNINFGVVEDDLI